MTDKKQALIELRDAVAAGEFPAGERGAARRVFPYAEKGFDSGVSAAEAFYGSLDASKALHEAVLPEWGWTIQAMGLCYVHSDEGEYCGSSDNPARAWLLAILEALIAMEDK